MPKTTFTFTCPHCEKENTNTMTSNLGDIPPQSDEPKEFYVTCSQCFSVFKVEYIVVISDVLESNGQISCFINCLRFEENYFERY